jgi:hypothetical protein
MIEARLSRRKALAGLAALAGAAGLHRASGAFERPGGVSSLGFQEVAHTAPDDPDHHVPPGYTARVLIAWGDGLSPDAPAFNPSALTAADQVRQFGTNNDFIAFLPLPRGTNGSDRGLLCVNHEFPNAHLMFRGIEQETAALTVTREQTEVEMASIGHAVVEIRRGASGWEVVLDSPYNRRLNAWDTPMAITGPAAGHERMKTADDPEGRTVLGTLGNCAGGVTPWGTVLSGEENFQEYFGGEPSPDLSAREKRNHSRYGVTPTPAGGWYRFHDRFHLGKQPTASNRFGWVVEFDPYDPMSRPAKRTALGRMKHEGATVALSADGRIAVYMGDDEKNNYLYKFVSSRPFSPADPQANRDLLDEGTLHVARFTPSGRVNWLPMVFGQGPLTAENDFHKQGDVLIETRRAADLLGATPMDRPEDIEVNPRTGRVYVMLTNNVDRAEPNDANPRQKNVHGHVVELATPATGGGFDHASTECEWDLFLLAGDPGQAECGSTFHPETSSAGWLSCPDNCLVDGSDRLWIATDGSPKSAKRSDGLFACDTSGSGRALTRRFFSAPRGSEVCGPCFTPDERTLFLAVQHPGEEMTRYVTNHWPDFRDSLPPRSAVLAITKDDGGVIGT